MSTYLELCKKTARFSGTIDPRNVTSVDGIGRLALLSGFVSEAWLTIQNDYRAWRFMIMSLPETAVLGAGQNKFTAASFDIPNWSEWRSGTATGTTPFKIWPTSGEGELPDANRGFEAELAYTDYSNFDQAYLTGQSRNDVGPPQAFTIDEQDNLVFYPTPNRDYRITGTYRRAAQELLVDEDVPIIPDASHHDTIAWTATMLLNVYDEAEQQTLILTGQQVDKRMAALRRRYLPVGASLVYSPLGTGRGFARPLSPRFVT